MGTFRRDTVLVHIGLNVAWQPIRQLAQKLIGLSALTYPNDYRGQKKQTLFETFANGRHKETEQ